MHRNKSDFYNHAKKGAIDTKNAGNIKYADV